MQPVADGPVREIILPEVLTERLDTGGWRVVSQSTTTTDMSRELVILFYCERG
jgi:hypothetical protein